MFVFLVNDKRQLYGQRRHISAANTCGNVNVFFRNAICCNLPAALSKNGAPHFFRKRGAVLMVKHKENGRREDTFIAIHFYVKYKGSWHVLHFQKILSCVLLTCLTL